MTRRAVLPNVLTVLGAMRRDLAAQGLGPTLLRATAALPGMPASDAQLLEETATLVERVDHLLASEIAGGLPIYTPGAPSPERLAGDRHGGIC